MVPAEIQEITRFCDAKVEILEAEKAKAGTELERKRTEYDEAEQRATDRMVDYISKGGYQPHTFGRWWFPQGSKRGGAEIRSLQNRYAQCEEKIAKWSSIKKGIV